MVQLGTWSGDCGAGRGGVIDVIRFWNHNFREFGKVENICMTCGFVIPAPTTEAKAKEWMRNNKSEEWWCGGAWHVFDRREINDHRGVGTVLA